MAIFPQTNIEFAALVGNALGTTDYRVSNLCTHANINKWARWKPYRYKGIDRPSEEVIKNGNFGIDPVGAESYSIATIESDRNFTGKGWTYAKPDETFRIGDFRGYSTTALAPCDVPGMITTSYYSNIDNDFAVISIPAMGYGDGGFGIGEMRRYSTLYLCLLVRKSDGTYAMQTSAQTIGAAGNTTIEFTVNGKSVGAGTIEWWVCASSIKCTTFGTPQEIGDASSYFVPLPSSRAETCHGTATSKLWSVVAAFNAALFGINNYDNWSPSNGVVNISPYDAGGNTALSTFGSGGGVFDEYRMGLQVGIRIWATGSGSRTAYVQPILSVNPNFAGGMASMDYAGGDLRMWEVVSWRSRTDTQNFPFGQSLSLTEIDTNTMRTGRITLSSGEVRYYIVSAPGLMVYPSWSGAVTPNQTLITQIKLRLLESEASSNINIKN